MFKEYTQHHRVMGANCAGAMSRRVLLPTKVWGTTVRDRDEKIVAQCECISDADEISALLNGTLPSAAPEINNSLMNEERIVSRVIDKHYVEKTFHKIKNANNGDWSSKMIPALLNTVFYDLVREELWDCLKMKEINFGSVNFKTLKALTINKIKEVKPELFA